MISNLEKQSKKTNTLYNKGLSTMNDGLDECIVQGAKNITDMEKTTHNLRARQTHQFYQSKYDKAKESDQQYDSIKI